MFNKIKIWLKRRWLNKRLDNLFQQYIFDSRKDERRAIKILFGNKHCELVSHSRYSDYEYCTLYLHPFVIDRSVSAEQVYEVSVKKDNSADPFSTDGVSTAIDFREEPYLTALLSWLSDLEDAVQDEVRLLRQKREARKIAKESEARELLNKQLDKPAFKKEGSS